MIYFVLVIVSGKFIDLTFYKHEWYLSKPLFIRLMVYHLAAVVCRLRYGICSPPLVYIL